MRAAIDEDDPDHRDGPGIGHVRQAFLGLVPPGLVFAGEGFSPFFQQRLPVLVGLVLLVRLGLGGGHPLRLVPVAANSLKAQMLPGRLARGIELQNPKQMCGRLLLQIVLLAPEGQFPLILGPVGRLGAALEILLDPRLLLPGRSGLPG